MKKQKAFTLIELLAVIIIISVILMIAVPIVNNIVLQSRKSAFLESVRSMMRIVENDPENPYFSVRSYSLTKGDLKNNENNYKLEYKNPIDANGYFYTNSQGNLFLKLSNDKWCVVKDYSDEQPYFHNDCSKFDTDDPTYSKWMTEEELNAAGYTKDDPEVERKAEYGYYDVTSWSDTYMLTKPEYYKEKTMYNVKYYSWQVVFNGIIQYDWWRGYTSCGPTSLPTCAGAPNGSSYFASVPSWSCVGINCTGTALVGDDREILTFTRMYWDRSWSDVNSTDSGWCNHVTGSGSTPCYKHGGHSAMLV